MFDVQQIPGGPKLTSDVDNLTSSFNEPVICVLIQGILKIPSHQSEVSFGPPCICEYRNIKVMKTLGMNILIRMNYFIRLKMKADRGTENFKGMLVELNRT